MVNGGGMDGWTDGRLEIPPCVLQDIGPLGLLPKKGKEQEEEQEKNRRKNKLKLF